MIDSRTKGRRRIEITLPRRLRDAGARRLECVRRLAVLAAVRLGRPTRPSSGDRPSVVIVDLDPVARARAATPDRPLENDLDGYCPLRPEVSAYVLRAGRDGAVSRLQ